MITGDISDLDATIPLTFFVPEKLPCVVRESIQYYDTSSIASKLFLTLDTDTSCLLARHIASVNAVIIIVSLLNLIVSTDKSYQFTPLTCSNPACDNNPTYCPGKQICAPQPFQAFSVIDNVCLILFSIDLFVRLPLCWTVSPRLTGAVTSTWDEDEKEIAEEEKRKPRTEPNMSVVEGVLRYLFEFRVVVDILAVLPSLVTKYGGKGGSGSLTFIRILRLFRILRILKISRRFRTMNELISKSLAKSYEAIFILLVYVVVIGTFMGSLMFYLEGGTFTVNEEYPEGAFLRDSYSGLIPTPFTSIPVAMYWAFVTLTTVGYGEITPSTDGGRAVCCICAIFGVFSIAMPMAVIGSNFNSEYAIFIASEKKREAKKQLIGIEADPIMEAIASKNVSKRVSKLFANTSALFSGAIPDSMQTRNKKDLSSSVNNSEHHDKGNIDDADEGDDNDDNVGDNKKVKTVQLTIIDT